MDKFEFLMNEYQTLREEIKETKERIFKIAGLAVAILPASYYLANAYKIDILIYSLPALMIIIVLMYLAESRALMRCGRYIRTRIETEIKDESGCIIGGWEHWLERRENNSIGRRSVDKIVAIYFYLLFIFYYAASVYLACATAKTNLGIIGFTVILAFYIGVAVVFIAFLVKCFPGSTSTDN